MSLIVINYSSLYNYFYFYDFQYMAIATVKYNRQIDG